MSDRNKREDSVKTLTKEEILVLAKKSFSFKNVDVVNYHLEAFSNEAMGFLGSHELLTIEARDSAYPESSSKTITYFVKTILPGCNDFEKKIFKNESKFLNEVVPRMMTNFKEEAWAPNCYLAVDNALVLENLKSQTFAVQKSEFDVKHLKTLVKTLARFQASSMIYEKQSRKPLCDIHPEFSEEIMFVTHDANLRSWLESGIVAAEAVAKSLNLNYSVIKEAYEIALKKILPVKGERNVFSHGDLWSYNMMFNEQGDKCRIVDFQMVSIKSYTIDLMQILYMNIASDKRPMLEEELISEYHNELNRCLVLYGHGERISSSDLSRDIEEKRICGIVAAAQILPIATTMCSDKLCKKFYKDVETLKHHAYVDRTDFVLEAIRDDANYRNKIEGSVADLVRYMEKLKDGN